MANEAATPSDAETVDALRAEVEALRAQLEQTGVAARVADALPAAVIAEEIVAPATTGGCSR